MAFCRKAGSSNASISRETLQRIIGRSKVFMARAPGDALLQRPLGLSTLERTMSKVRLAIEAYSAESSAADTPPHTLLEAGLFLAKAARAMESWPKAMTAKV